MKISFTTFACPQWGLEQIIESAVACGYQGVEFRCDALHQHGVEVAANAAQRRTIRSRLEEEKLHPCCLATSLQFATEGVVDKALPLLDLAAEIGCPALRVLCGPIPEEISKAQAIERVAKQLREAALMHSHTGVQMWLETHDSFCKAADAAAAVRLAGHPTIGIVYDNLHPLRKGESVETTVAAISGLVRHVHFHDAISDPDKVIITPMGRGDLPVDEMFVGLIKIGFDGFISGEWFYDAYGPDPHEALKAYFRDMTNLAQRYGIHLGRTL